MGIHRGRPSPAPPRRPSVTWPRCSRCCAPSERPGGRGSRGPAGTLLIEKLKLTIKKLRHDRFGRSSERGALLDQPELQLADLEANAAQIITEKIAVPASSAASQPAGRCRSICSGSALSILCPPPAHAAATVDCARLART
nr:transposase [Bradyrhizobium sp. 197]